MINLICVGKRRRVNELMPLKHRSAGLSLVLASKVSRGGYVSLHLKRILLTAFDVLHLHGEGEPGEPFAGGRRS